MADPGVYLEKLSAFSRMLHLEGLTVSPQETADAAKVLIRLGLEDRQQVKTALRMVYAKSREEQVSFDRVFDGFFLSEEAIRAQAKEHRQREQAIQFQRKKAEEELRLNGKPMDLTEEQLMTYAAMARSTGSGFGISWRNTRRPPTGIRVSTTISSTLSSPRPF